MTEYHKYLSSNNKKFLSKEDLQSIQNVSNRSDNQTNFLYNLLDCNFPKLVKLEEVIKKNHILYCPSSLEEINKIINLYSA